MTSVIEKHSSVSVNDYATKDNIIMTRGEKICAFIEHYCLIPEGAQVGQPIKLMKFQRSLFWTYLITRMAKFYGEAKAALREHCKNG
jgi:hypothetical protein